MENIESTQDVLPESAEQVIENADQSQLIDELKKQNEMLKQSMETLQNEIKQVKATNLHLAMQSKSSYSTADPLDAIRESPLYKDIMSHAK